MMTINWKQFAGIDKKGNDVYVSLSMCANSKDVDLVELGKREASRDELTAMGVSDELIDKYVEVKLKNNYIWSPS